MADLHRPRHGSLAFMGRKRAKQIYPRVSHKRPEKVAKVLDFAGYKVGMAEVMMIDDRAGSPTQNQEIAVPATIIETPPLKVAGVRAYSKNPYGQKIVAEAWAEDQDKPLARKIDLAKKKKDAHKEIASLEKKLAHVSRITLLVNTQPDVAGIAKKKPELFEAGIGGTVHEGLALAKNLLGKQVSVKDVFKDGEHVDTVGVTLGKGYQGSIKRFGVKRLPHKSQKVRRKVGNLGPWHPHKVRPTVPQMGQMGFHRRTQFNNRIIKVGTDPKEINGHGWKRYGLVKSEYLILRGSVQGPTNRAIRMRHAIRMKEDKPVTAQISSVSIK